MFSKSARKKNVPVRFPGLILLMTGQLLLGCGKDPASPRNDPIDPDDEIVITSPQGGETFSVGGSMRVDWILKGKGQEEVNSVTLHISPFEGSGWAKMSDKSIAREDAEKWGHYAWSIPDSVYIDGQAFTLADRSAVRLKVMQYSTGDTNKIAYTRNSFSIGGR